MGDGSESVIHATKIKDYRIEKEGILSKERTQAQRLAGEARQFFRKCEEEMEQCCDPLGSSELENLEQRVKNMETVLEDDHDDLNNVMLALGTLKEVSTLFGTIRLSYIGSWYSPRSLLGN